MVKKFISVLICLCMIFVSITPALANNSRQNPDRVEIEEKLEALAKKRGIPSVIAKSVARVESCFQQYTKNGNVYVGSRGSIGIMQINNKYGNFDTKKLQFDIDYNLEAGIEMLLEKWDMALNQLPQVGNMDPNVLENWYFAIWAYNGWADSNNPNTGKKKHTYTELVYMMSEQEYGKPITLIDPALLPRKDKPKKSEYFETPTPVHRGDIVMYSVGQPMFVDSDVALNLRKEPTGKIIGKLESQEKMEIVSGPKLVRGYYWYEVKNDDKQGWVVGNWISLDEIESIYYGVLEIKEDEAPLRNVPFGSLDETLDKGTIVKILSKPYFDGHIDWLQVETEDKRAGWLESYWVVKSDKKVTTEVPIVEIETTTRTYVKPGEEDHAIVIVTPAKEEVAKEEVAKEEVVKEEVVKEEVVKEEVVKEEVVKEEVVKEEVTKEEVIKEEIPSVDIKVEIKYAVVDVSSYLNMRELSSTSSAKIDKLYNQDKVELLEGPIANDGYTWYKVKNSRSGNIGWAASEFLILN